MCDKEKILVQMADELTVTIPMNEYRELVNKAERLNVIADSIRQNLDNGKSYNIVEDGIVRLMTGTANYRGKADTAEESEG